MNRLRVLMLTERFWPLVGREATLVRLLAEGLHTAGDDVTIVTRKQVAHWPDQFLFREVPVVRLPEGGVGRWSSWRLARHLKNWLSSRPAGWDAVFVAGMSPSIFRALRYVSAGRILVYAGRSPPHPQADARWLGRHFRGIFQHAQGSRTGRLPYKAHWIVVVETTDQRDLLVASGLPRERIQLLRLGVPLPAEVTRERKAEARAVLAATNADLSAPPPAVVGLHVGALQPGRHLDELIQAWKHVVTSVRNAQLWLIGDGPERGQLWQRVRDSGLARQVLLPGMFDDLAELYAAADFFVMPEPAQHIRWPLLESLAHGLPAVATDSPRHRELLPEILHPYLAISPSATALASSILKLLAKRDQQPVLAAACRKHIGEHFAWSQMVCQFRELCAPRSVIPATDLPGAVNESC